MDVGRREGESVLYTNVSIGRKGRTDRRTERYVHYCTLWGGQTDGVICTLLYLAGGKGRWMDRHVRYVHIGR